MWKKYIAMGIVSVLLLTNIPGTVYAAEPMVNLEEQPEENIPGGMSEEPSAEEIDESGVKELQGSTVTEDGELSEEPSDNSENLTSGESIDGQETRGEDNQAQEDEEIHHEEKEMDTTNKAGQDSEETDLVQNEAPLEEIPPLENVPVAQSDTLDMQSTEGEYLPYDGAKYKLKYSVGEEGITIKGMVPGDAVTDDAGQVIMPDDLGQLVIPGTIGGQPVVAIGNYAFQECSGFNGQLIIPDSIKVIGSHAFSKCSGLTGGLVLPVSLTSIEEYAFFGCSNLTGSLIIPQNVETIGFGAFEDCSGLSGELKIPEKVIYIQDTVFRGCSNLTGSLIIPQNVEIIGCDAFSGCSGLSGNLIIPEKVTSIGALAFYGCTGFTGDLVIPQGVTSIGESAFEGCRGFTGDLVIPQGMASIEKSTFKNCTGFTGNLVIPQGVTSIGEYAFESVGFTGDLVIPQGVISIGESAFESCRGDNLTIPDSVASIGNRTFAKCQFTGGVLVPESVSSVGSELFADGHFEVIAIGMRNIPSYVFKGAVSPVKLLDSVENIEENAFYDSNIKEIVISPNIKIIRTKAFYGCTGLTTVKIPYGVKKIENDAFSGCSDLRNIEIPASVEEIGERAFVDLRSGGGMPKYFTILGKDTVISENALSARGSGCSCFVYGYKGSTAEEYAKKPYSLAAFIPLETPEVTEHRVTTSQELLDAIDSYRHIILADGIYEIPACLDLEGVISLTIEAENPGKAEILSKSTTVPVVITSVCKGIEIYGCILGHESVVEPSGCGFSEAYVVSCDSSLDVKIGNCDLYGCGTEGGSFSFCENISIDHCVIRDCMRRIASVKCTNNLKITNCTISGNAYKEELAQICKALALYKSDVSFNNSLFINNFNFGFDGDWYNWDSSDEKRYELQTIDCNFYHNAWDGENPGAYGICLNGITWQMDGDTLKIGYPLQLGTDKVIQSEKGSVLPYSDSSLPWKNCSYQQIDVAEGVEYDRGNGVTVNASGADMEVTVPMTSEEYQNLLAGILTQEEIQAVEEGQRAEVEIVVADGEIVISEKDRQAIKDMALDNGYTIGKHLDIAMYVQVGNDSKRAVEQTKLPVRLVLEIPEELRNDKRNFVAIRMHNGKTDLLGDLDQNPSTVTIETNLFSTYALAYGATEGISGNVSSFGGENEEVSLRVVDSSGTIIAEAQAVGGKALYKLENVPAGSYTLRAEKKNHVSRDYSVTVTADKATVQNIALWLTGDVNGDGKVNAKDKKILYNHIAGSSPLTDYTFLVGDVNRDGRINAKDKKTVYNHIAGNVLLWN